MVRFGPSGTFAEDLGLRKPWYWDIFMRDLDEHHHGQHLGTYSWRPTLWWHPAAEVSPEERDWLEARCTRRDCRSA
ncbi:hypothetical protein [Nocardia sp. NPDC002869]|uniref:hypothetical protein n=1 Tax=Nocardia sp. NPDC002869 TaxID=3161032 RepID=UPI00398D64FD